jgi:hypothetical protein
MSDEIADVERELPHERVLPFPFIVVDAALQRFLVGLFHERNTPRTKIEWVQLSSGGSCHLLLTTRSQLIGKFLVSAVGTEQTHIVSDVVPEYAARGRNFDVFLNLFADRLYERQKTLESLISRESATRENKEGNVIDEATRQQALISHNALSAQLFEPKRRGPKAETYTRWARAQARAGRTAEEMLDEYMLQRKQDPTNEEQRKKALKILRTTLSRQERNPT